MYATLVVPLSDPQIDPDGVSEQALVVAAQLAERCDAAILLVSVLTNGQHGERDDVEDWVDRNEDLDALERQAYLERVAARLGGLAVTTELRFGDPATEILAAAREAYHPLIVMASHGRTAVRRRIVGSVARQIVEGANCPVIIVPAAHDAVELATDVDLNNVIIALNDTFTAGAVAEAALDTLHALAIEVDMVQLIEAVDPLLRTDSSNEHPLVTTTQQVPQHFLAGEAETLVARGYDVRWELRIGHPATELARAAERERAGLIVLAARGRGGVDHSLLGALTERLTEERRIPLLLVPLEERALQRAAQAARQIRSGEGP
jgi:nucleotide-binding universal stress UspA family protein